MLKRKKDAFAMSSKSKSKSKKHMKVEVEPSLARLRRGTKINLRVARQTREFRNFYGTNSGQFRSITAISMEAELQLPSPTPLASKDPVPSSSPAFSTPAPPPPERQSTRTLPPAAPPRPTVLPILLPPQLLRPHAVRILTKKHGLNVQTSALQALASFIGRHCGTGWREEGLAEQVLEEVARMWKRQSGDVIVKDEADTLKGILKALEGCMTGGRLTSGKPNLSRHGSLVRQGSLHSNGGRNGLMGERQSSFGMSGLEVEAEEDDESRDPRAWQKIISAFEQPRLAYNVTKRHFEP